MPNRKKEHLPLATAGERELYQYACVGSPLFRHLKLTEFVN
jgi:hypothetical protein